MDAKYGDIKNLQVVSRAHPPLVKLYSPVKNSTSPFMVYGGTGCFQILLMCITE